VVKETLPCKGNSILYPFYFQVNYAILSLVRKRTPYTDVFHDGGA